MRDIGNSALILTLSDRTFECLNCGKSIDCGAIDTIAQSLTVFGNDRLPQTIKADGSLSDPLLPELELPISYLFIQ